MADAFIVEADFTLFNDAVLAHQANNGLGEGGLAGTRLTHDGQHLTGIDLERDVMHYAFHLMPLTPAEGQVIYTE